MELETILLTLKEPFPESRIHWRVGATNKEKTSGIALAYLDARDVMNRLDECCVWQCRYPISTESYSLCEIGLLVQGEWLWRTNGAGATQIEAEKGGLSDAFKRAAVLWGVGRYLYYLPNKWVDLDNRKIKKTPELPKWAKPEFISPDIKYMMDVRDNFDSISAIKVAIREGRIDDVVAFWTELTNEEIMALNRAPTKGGIFTIDERKYMNTKEFNDLYYNIPENRND